MRWLWPGYVPLGALTIIDGDPGLGKSTLVLDLVARLSTGRPMPDGSRAATMAHDVILISTEDGVADTIVPRLLAAQADLDNVHLLETVQLPVKRSLKSEDGRTEEQVIGCDHVPPVVPDHVQQIEEQVRAMAARLVVVDPLAAHVPDGVDLWKDQSARRALKPLAEMAQRQQCAVILVRHLNKGQGKALYRGGGSIGIVGAARMGLVVARDPEDPTRRVLACTKSNLAREPQSLRYSLVDTGPVATVRWEGTVNVTADALLAAQASENLGDRTQTILRFALAHPDGVTAAQAAVEAGVDNDQAGKYLRRLVDSGRLVKLARGRFGPLVNVGEPSEVSGRAEKDTDPTPASDSSDTSTWVERLSEPATGADDDVFDEDRWAALYPEEFETVSSPALDALGRPERTRP